MISTLTVSYNTPVSVLAKYEFLQHMNIYICVQAEIFVTRLLKHETDPHTDMQHEAKGPTKDNELNTSLHYAAQNGWTSIAKKLMEHQSIPTDTNQEGLTPLELAVQNGHNECATFLVKSMEPVRYSSYSILGKKCNVQGPIQGWMGWDAWLTIQRELYSFIEFSVVTASRFNIRMVIFYYSLGGIP